MPNQILLNVDDHEVARYARSRILTGAGFTVHEAASGAEAIDAVAKYKPDLVLLDVHLPDLNGMEVCRRRKADMGDDEAGQAFSLAIAIQTNAAVRAWLPEVSRSASPVEALVLGKQGEAAVLTFGDEVNVVQVTTSDAAHLDKAFRGLKASGGKSRSIDAVLKATQLLGEATAGRRRVLLLIAQAGDAGSKANLRDVMNEVERRNITVYCLTMPRVGRDLLGSVRVSGLSSQGSRDTGFVVSADLTKLVPEIYRGSKTAAGEDAVTLLTRYTSGTMIPFRSRKDLDAAISSIGEELHTGYVLTYTPSGSGAGYHRIGVTVARDGASVRARPGYYVAEP